MPVAPELSIEVFGEQVVNRRLVRLRSTIEDARPAWRAVARVLAGAVAANFRTQGASSGERWQDLKPSTVAAKRRSPDAHVRANAARVLRATDRLRDSLVDEAHADHVSVMEPSFMRWGSRVDYGKFHQSSQPRTRIPFRPPARLSENAKREAARALQRAFVELGQ